ncbi:unnamed protein product [Chrysoparadoxa australica]
MGYEPLFPVYPSPTAYSLQCRKDYLGDMAEGVSATSWLSTNCLEVARLLDLRDICRLASVNKRLQSSYKRKAKVVCISEGGGVTDDLRMKYWAHCLQVEKAKAQLTAGKDLSSLEFYRSCVQQSPHSPCSGKAALSSTGGEGEILRDVSRTYPSHDMFLDPNGQGQNMLANVLRACLVTQPDVGYCQGMNFVSGALLMTALLKHPTLGETSDADKEAVNRDGEAGLSFSYDDPLEWTGEPEHTEIEEEVFWLMNALTSGEQGIGAELTMRNLWMPGVPQMKLRVYQFDKLLAQQLPQLHAHFRAISLQLEVLVSQWFLTLFSYSLPLHLLVKAWDIIFTDGWKALLRIGISRLKEIEKMLLGMEIEEMSHFLREFRINCASASVKPQELLVPGFRVKVTRRVLRDLQEDFAVQLLREHLDGGGEWLTRYGDHSLSTSNNGNQGGGGIEAIVRLLLLDVRLLDRLRDELDFIEAPVAEDTASYQAKITAAAERCEMAHREFTSLSFEAMHIRLDIEEHVERQEMLQQQMKEVIESFEFSCEVAEPPPQAPPAPVYAEQSPRRTLDGQPKSLLAKLAMITAPIPAAVSRIRRRVSQPQQPEVLHAEAQLVKDLAQYRQKLSVVAAQLSELRTNQKRCNDRLEISRLEAEEAEEVKCSLSEQFLQLMLEQERRIDGHLRAYTNHGTSKLDVRRGLD